MREGDVFAASIFPGKSKSPFKGPTKLPSSPRGGGQMYDYNWIREATILKNGPIHEQTALFSLPVTCSSLPG